MTTRDEERKIHRVTINPVFGYAVLWPRLPALGGGSLVDWVERTKRGSDAPKTLDYIWQAWRRRRSIRGKNIVCAVDIAFRRAIQLS